MATGSTTTLDLPHALRNLLEARSHDDEFWILALETGTRLEGAPGKPCAWFCVSEQRAVLMCAVADPGVTPLWVEFAPGSPPICEESRIGRDEFRHGGVVAFVGPMRGGARLRFAVELSGMARGPRLVRAGRDAQAAGEADRARWLYLQVRDPDLDQVVRLHTTVLDGCDVGEGRYIESAPPYIRASLSLLAADSGELILAVLEASTPQEELDAAWFYVLTDRRALLVSAVEDGREVAIELESGAPLEVTDEVGRDPIACGGRNWRSTFANEARYHELASVPALDPRGRLLEMARLHKTHGAVPRAVSLLTTVLDREPSADVEALRALCRGAGTYGGLAAALMREVEPDAFARALGTWQFGTDAAEQVTSTCLAADSGAAQSWTLPLQRRVFNHRIQATKDDTTAAAIRLSHARSLHNGGASQEAAAEIDRVLDGLPDASLSDLVPDAADDEVRSLRVNAWQLLGETGQTLRSRSALAESDPLSIDRVTALSQTDGPASERATIWLELLTGRLGATDAVLPAPQPVDAATLEHPLVARSAYWEKVQAFVATQSIPDTNALRAYCQPLGRSASEVAVDALADATVFLGVPQIHAYVSRGERRRGIRAFDGDPPFLLVGADHIDGDGDVDMTAAELRFALCAEAAHVRLGHVRITSAELWTGIWDKSWSVADFALALTPAKILEKPIGAIGKGLPLLQRVGLGSVQEAVDYAGQWAGKFKPGGKKGPGGSVGPEQRELLGMARALQLSADRAGLLFCGDLRSAVRAIFLSNPGLIPVLEIARRQGLATTLARRDDEGQPMYPELALRLGALASFWMSGEFSRLRSGPSS